MEPESDDVMAATSYLLQMAVDVTTQQHGVSPDEAREHLARKAAELAVTPDELAILVLTEHARRRDATSG